MAIIYCIWNKEHGYYGQDVNGSSDNFPRIEKHINNVFAEGGFKDNSTIILRESGLGGCHYGYWTNDDFFGIGEDVWNDFKSYYNLQQDDATLRMHLAEVCYIVSNRQDLAGVNRAIGGGGMELDFSSWYPIQQLLRSKWRKDLSGYDIDITFKKEGLVRINDLTDLMPQDNQGTIPALNKVLYAQKYACLRILSRVAPYYALNIDYNGLGTITSWIAQYLRELIKDKEIGKRIFKKAFLTKFEAVCDDLSSDMNVWLSTVKANFSIDLWTIFNTAENGEFVNNMCEYVATHVYSAISSAIVNSINAKGPIKKEIVSQIRSQFFFNRNTAASNSASMAFRLAFRLGRNEILNATGDSMQTPSWWIKAQSRCTNKRPTLYVAENIIKGVGFRNFRRIVYDVATNKPPLVKNVVNHVATEDFLMMRTEQVYMNLFGSNSTTITQWPLFFRAAISSMNPGFEQVVPDGANIDMLTTERKVVVESPRGYRYEWGALWDIYNRWAGRNYTEIPLGWY